MQRPVLAILTISDRASRGEYADRGGEAVEEYLRKRILTPVKIIRRVVPDDREGICSQLRELVDVEGCSLIVTTGGTGPAPRDVTPEATQDVCDRLLPGFGEQMRRVSVAHVPTALLSRQCAGLRNSCLILNVPGNPKAIAECLDAVFSAVPHCIELLGGPRLEIAGSPSLPH